MLVGLLRQVMAFVWTRLICVVVMLLLLILFVRELVDC